MLKILQARLQQFMNCELPHVQAGYRKGRGTRDQITNIHCIIEKAREFQKNIYFYFMWLVGCGGLVVKSCPTLATPWSVACQAPLSMRFSRQEYWSGLPFPSPSALRQSLWLCGSQQTVENSSRDGNTRPPYLPSVKPVCRSRSNRTGHGTIDWFKIGKGIGQAVYHHPAYLNYMQNTSGKMPGLDKAQAGIKIARRNVNNLRYAADNTLMAESEEELKSLLMKVKEDSE